MNADRNSDESVVPSTSANNEATEASAESIEERDSTKRNAEQADVLRTQGRAHSMTFGLHGVREAARKDSQLRFTALLHHVNEDCLRNAFFNLKKTAAVGVDGVTWHDYEQDLEDLQMRFARFGLKLHESKTPLIEFGKYAAERRDRRGEGRPETFDFLGFTHKCARTRKHGWFTIHRHSIAKRMRATFQKIKTDLQKRRHHRLGDTGRWLRRVVQGWLNYHAVPSNSQSLCRFIDEVTRLWLSEIHKRSQRGRSGWTWERMQRLVRLHLPRPRVTHPYPNERFRARLKVGAV